MATIRTKKPLVLKTKAPVIKPAKVASGLTVPVVDTDGKKSGTVTLPKEVFDVSVSPQLIAQAIMAYRANQRQGNAHTKTRGDVTGSRKKVWRQKGTGRARHGDRYSPIFVGGGVTHGPKTKDWSKSIPAVMRRKALAGALTAKHKSADVLIIDGLEKAADKTAKLVAILKKNNYPVKHGKVTQTILIATPSKVEKVYLASRNITNVSVREANLLNIYEVMNHKKLIIARDAITVLAKTAKIK